MIDPLKTDKTVYPEPPPPALPQAGGTFTDPTFGTTLLRVTDERDGQSNTNSYSYWPSLNCDNTRLFYTSDNKAMLCDFDPVSLKTSNQRPLFQRPAFGAQYPWSEDAIWSGTDPDVIYCHWAMVIYAYNVRTSTYSTVADFIGRVATVAHLQQMSKSPDDAVFGFNTQDANWKRLGCLCWRRATNDLYTYVGTVDEVQVDKTGQYLIQMTGQQGVSAVESRVVDLNTRSFTDLMDGAPDYSPGHKDCGRGVVAGEDNWINRINSRSLANPHTCITLLDFTNDWSQGKHVSWLADDESWLLVSCFVANGLPSSGLFKNELFLVSTDGKQNVRRVCHHHSTLLGQYWNSPRADISRDGQFAVFTSNWGSTTRRDVFVVRIPPTIAGLSAKLRQLADDYDAGRVK